MTDRQQHDQEIIAAYRQQRAPYGLATRIVANARRARRFSQWRWIVPAGAAAVFMLSWMAWFEYVDQVPQTTLSMTSIGSLPDIAAVRRRIQTPNLSKLGELPFDSSRPPGALKLSIAMPPAANLPPTLN